MAGHCHGHSRHTHTHTHDDVSLAHVQVATFQIHFQSASMFACARVLLICVMYAWMCACAWCVQVCEIPTAAESDITVQTQQTLKKVSSWRQ